MHHIGGNWEDGKGQTVKVYLCVGFLSSVRWKSLLIYGSFRRNSDWVVCLSAHRRAVSGGEDLTWSREPPGPHLRLTRRYINPSYTVIAVTTSLRTTQIPGSERHHGDKRNNECHRDDFGDIDDADGCHSGRSCGPGHGHQGKDTKTLK